MLTKKAAAEMVIIRRMAAAILDLFAVFVIPHMLGWLCSKGFFDRKLKPLTTQTGIVL
jgi:hypothetical protein